MSCCMKKKKIYRTYFGLHNSVHSDLTCSVVKQLKNIHDLTNKKTLSTRNKRV